MRFLATICALALVSCAGTRTVIFTPKNWPEDVPGTVFKPKFNGPAPAVLLIHGGVKIGEDGRWVMNGIARKLANRGYYVLNITYRDGAKWPYPAPLEDVEQGLHWLRKNAAAEGIDPTRIGVFGYSERGPITMHATRAATPAVMCTTIPPAKSKTPRSAKNAPPPPHVM